MPDTGRGSIAAQQLVSAGIRDTIRKHHKTPALEILNKAFMERDIELMKQLFDDIITMKNKSKFTLKFRSWAANILYNSGEKALNEDDRE